MTMSAGLIAKFGDIDLQGIYKARLEVDTMSRKGLGKLIGLASPGGNERIHLHDQLLSKLEGSTRLGARLPEIKEEGNLAK